MKGLAPWLLFSLVLHAGLFQWAPTGTPWGCCGGMNPQSGAGRAFPSLSVRMPGSSAGVTAALPVEKSGPAQAAHRQTKDDAEADAKTGFLPYYFATRELDRKPEASTEILIADQASMAGVAPGNVVLELLVNETGRLDSVRVESATLPAAFQDIAKDAFLKAVFTPGFKDGMAVKSRLRIEVVVEDAAASDFQPTGMATAPSAG